MSQAQRFLLISYHNSYRIAPYITAAKKLGLDVTIASQGKHSLVSEVANGIHIDFENINAAIEIIRQENKISPFVGILGSDDQTVELAALVAQVLQLSHNPPQAAQYSHRKDLARAHLALNGCPVPAYCLIDLTLPIQNQMAGLPWPCVLKPVNMSASRGVIRANNEAEFIAACEQLRPILATAIDEFEQTHILIEDYIDGIEIAYEGFLHNEKLQTITIFDKPDPLVGPYFAETIYATPSMLDDSIQQNIRDVIHQACLCYGLTTGAIHAECRIDKNNKIWILEIASRTIGGDCGQMLEIDDFSVEALAISLAIDKPITVNKQEQAHAVMMIPVRQKGLLKRVEGLLAARQTEYIDKIDIVINQGHDLIPQPEGNQYLGYIFATAETTEQVTSAVREAYAHLKFVTTPVFPII